MSTRSMLCSRRLLVRGPTKRMGQLMGGSSTRLVVAATIPETIGKFMRVQLPALENAGFEIHVVSSSGNWHGGLPAPSVHRHTIMMSRAISPGSDVVALAQWVQLLRKLRPAMIFGSSPKAGLLSMLAGRLTRVPRRVFLHRGARWETATGAQRRLLMGADKLTMRSATDTIAVSNSLADLLLNERLAEQRPTVLGQGGSKGVNLAVFHPRPASVADARPPTIGFVGRLARDKGLEQLVMVFDLVREARRDATLTIAGYLDWDSPPPSQIMDRIERDPQISWDGPTSEVPAFLAELDVLVFPSQREGLPNVVLEAAACGVPVVGWDVTGVRDAIKDGESGIIVRHGDVAAMAVAVSEVLARGRGYYSRRCVRWARAFDEGETTKLIVEYLSSPRFGCPS